jgi:hypothetical protein
MNNEKAFLQNIKQGTVVWTRSSGIGANQDPKSGGLHTVLSLTPHFFVLDGYSGTDRKFRRDDGWQNTRWCKHVITSIATPAEIQNYHEAEHQAAARRKERERVAQARQQLKAELSNLFADENVWVGDADNENFYVQFNNMKEAQVRKLAKALPKYKR